MNLFGVEIIESPFAVMQEPNRKHKRRKWMSDAYHKRIQKKWTKRYGTREVPCALFFSPSAVGLPGGDFMAVGPRSMALLKNFR